MALAALAVLLTASFAYAQDPTGWVGKKVVTKGRVPLRVGDKVVDEDGEFRVYTVESVNGPYLWLTYQSIAGYVQADQVVPFDQAIDYYTQFVNTNQAAWAFSSRSRIWAEKGEYDIAIADGNEAIRLNPKSEVAHINRGFSLNRKKEYDRAISDYNEAIHLNPTNASVYVNRGLAWLGKREYEKSLADFNEAIRLDPKVVWAFNNRAWIWATCPDPKFRDGKKAVESAIRACELRGWKNAVMLDTLAVAYAECGEFTTAIQWQEKANKLFTDAETVHKNNGEAHLKLFQDKKPVRDKE